MQQSPVSDIINALRQLVQSLRNASRAAEQNVGLSGAQLFVLETLQAAGKLSVNELAERTHTHQSTVSVVASKLVTKGLVARERSESDARVQILSITRSGKAKMERATSKVADRSVQDRLLSAIAKLPAGDQHQLRDLLQRVLHDAGISDATPELFLEEPKEERTQPVPVRARTSTTTNRRRA